MSNSIVAVAIVVVALSLVAIDLNENLVKKTVFITAILMTLSIAATLININPFLGLITNAVVIFWIVYEGFYTYKENMYFPFLLAYIFMGLSAPVQPTGLPLRLVAILVGCVYILLIQLVLNRRRFHKTVSYTKKQLLSVIQQQLDSLLDGTANDASPLTIYPLSKPMFRALYDTRSKGSLLLVLSLENIYTSLCHLSTADLSPHDKDCLYHLMHLLEGLDIYFYNDTNKSDSLERILSIWQTLQHYSNTESLSPIINALKDLPEALNLMDEVSLTNNSVIYSPRSWFKPIILGSATFRFALKLSTSLSLIILLSDLLNLTYGRWMIFPLIAIIQPYMEGTGKKAFERVLGTILGILLFVPIFAVVQDNMMRLNITIFLAYINLFMKKYYISTSLIAVSALGSVAMGGAGAEILVFRIFFTVLGCILGLLINKYLFPQTLKEYLSELIKEYEQSKKLLEQDANAPLKESQKYDLILKNKLLEYEILQYTSN
ncbi:MAG: FUSC family protein [Cellulosilyticaceae bacterium]